MAPLANFLAGVVGGVLVIGQADGLQSCGRGCDPLRPAYGAH